jgi:hypothetical protein
LQGDIIESGSVAALEFQLDLADRLGTAAGGRADLALVDRSLDTGRRARLDRKGCARDIGGEKRLQIAGNPVRQMLAALRGVKVRTALGELVLPFAARQEIAATWISLLDGLNEPAALLPNAKAQASTLQRQVRGVVIGALASARAGRRPKLQA